MVTTNVRIALTVLMIGAGLGVANAQERWERPQMTFEALDIDGSGEITAEDIEALRAERFAAVDTNGDGSISEAEFIAQAEARAAERAAAMFARLDADGDGALSRDVLERRGGPRISERMISRADTDKSGGVSAEEFEAAHERMAEHRGGRDHQGKGPFNR